MDTSLTTFAIYLSNITLYRIQFAHGKINIKLTKHQRRRNRWSKCLHTRFNAQLTQWDHQSRQWLKQISFSRNFYLVIVNPTPSICGSYSIPSTWLHTFIYRPIYSRHTRSHCISFGVLRLCMWLKFVLISDDANSFHTEYIKAADDIAKQGNQQIQYQLIPSEYIGLGTRGIDTRH